MPVCKSADRPISNPTSKYKIMHTKVKPTSTITSTEIGKEYHAEPFMGTEPVMTQDISMTARKRTRYSFVEKEIIHTFILN